MAETMQALVYEGPGKLVLRERPIPAPAAGEVLIQIKNVSICGSDLGAYRHASERFAPPLVLGHEFSGVIADTGEGVLDFTTGQRVSVNPMLFCQSCYHCRRGEVNLCGHRRSLGTAIGGTQTDGAMREYLTIRSSAVVPLRDEVSFRDGAMLEPMGVCLACAKCARDVSEENVVVIGAGPIGLLTVKFLRALGVPNVIVIDVMDTRLLKAAEFGAAAVINAANTDSVQEVLALTNGVGADRVIVAAGVTQSVLDAFAMVRSGGAVVLVALMHDKIEFDPMQIVARGIRFVGSYMFTSEMEESMNLLADGKVAVGDLVTSTLPLARGKEAFDLLLAPGNQEIKVQLAMNE